MATSKLKFVRETNMFGTTITLANTSGTYKEILTEGFNPADPLAGLDTKIKTGHLFRSPGIKKDDWAPTFNSLYNCNGKFNLTAELSDTDGKQVVTAWVRFAEPDDAALFAWSSVEIWQKWSDALEDAHKQEAKVGKKTNVFVDKDGKLKATVTVTSLGN
jgi:hypothetical protein